MRRFRRFGREALIFLLGFLAAHAINQAVREEYYGSGGTSIACVLVLRYVIKLGRLVP